MYTYKYQRQTKTSRGITNIYFNGVKVGYYLKENSPYRTKCENYFLYMDNVVYAKSFSNSKKLKNFIENNLK